VDTPLFTVQQIETADDEPRPADPAPQHSRAHDEHAHGKRPGDDEQLPEVLAEQGAAELVLRGPAAATAACVAASPAT